MKISHKNLELARRDPINYKSNIGSIGFPGRAGWYRYWQFATRIYHRDDISTAYSYLENLIDNKFVDNISNKKKLEEHLIGLDKYDQDFRNLNNKAIGFGQHLKMDLNFSNMLTGEIGRVDQKQDGSHEIFLFSKEDFLWEKELRFPLIQYHYSNYIFNIPLNKVRIGIYNFEYKQHTSKVFSKDEVNDAINEVTGLSKKIYTSK